METNQLTMRWIPVTDASGRTHMEAVWITDTPVAVQAASSTQAA